MLENRNSRVVGKRVNEIGFSSQIRFHSSWFDSPTKREERKHLMVPLPSECRERKVKHPAPWAEKEGFASAFQGLPWGY